MAYDDYELQRQLDKCKTQVFLKKDSAFVSAVMCQLRFSWRRDIPTAQANMLQIQWNPDWFETLPPLTRETVLVHELWHPAKLHMLRKGARDHKLFNIACDIDINNGLESQGFSFEKVEWAWRNSADQVRALGLSWPVGTPPEKIYEDLLPHASAMPDRGSWGDPGGQGDLQDDQGQPEDEKAAEIQKVINVVMQAVAATKVSEQPGSVPGDVEAYLEAFLKPVVPWEVLLQRWLQDLAEPDFDWTVRDRRFADDDDTYFPGEKAQQSRLQHLAWIMDTSGSFSDQQLVRANSESKHVWDYYQPEQMTFVQFDTAIRRQFTIGEGQVFNGQDVKGRGGTDLRPVRDWIQKHRPTAAVIFTDLDCRPMQPLDVPIPIIWICVDNPGMTVPFGTLIHIET